ncbi:MAG: helix-turn-helix domain-containing protein [Pseudomonadota bacterium]
MADERTTRDRLVETAAYLFHRRGFHGVGLSEILKLAKAPKGVLYHHFPGGKPELAEAAIAFAADVFAAQIEAAGAACQCRGQFIEALGGLTVDDLEATQFKAGCPLATIALETAPDDQRLSQACRQGFDLWIGVIAGHLGRLGSAAPEREAELVLASLEGAMAIARTRKDARIVLDAAKALARVGLVEG